MGETDSRCKNTAKQRIIPAIAIIFIISIIIMGVVICMYSAKYNNNHIENPSTADEPSSSYEEPYYISNKIVDEGVYNIGEAVEFPDGTITMTEAKFTGNKIDPKIGLDKNTKECKFTFEIKNTSNNTIELDYIDFYAYPSSTHDDPCYYAWLGDSIGYSEEPIVIAKGETFEAVTYHGLDTELKYAEVAVFIDRDEEYKFNTYFSTAE